MMDLKQMTDVCRSLMCHRMMEPFVKVLPGRKGQLLLFAGLIVVALLVDALPVSAQDDLRNVPNPDPMFELETLNVAEGYEVNLFADEPMLVKPIQMNRSEEHTSELQSRGHLVCRLLLEKKTPDHTRAKAGRAPGGRHHGHHTQPR